jgi:hypothetical protein
VCYKFKEIKNIGTGQLSKQAHWLPNPSDGDFQLGFLVSTHFVNLDFNLKYSSDFLFFIPRQGGAELSHRFP